MEEINDKEKFLKKNSLIVDVGAAPGGWSQIAAQKIARHDRWSKMRPLIRPNIVSIDLNHMDALEGCYFINDDFTFIEVQDQIKSFFNSKVDVVMSDLAPARTGILTADHYRQILLCEAALDFAKRMLKPSRNSVFLCKVYQGPDEPAFRKHVKAYFSSVVHYKPKASRKSSREYYLFAKGLTNRQG